MDKFIKLTSERQKLLTKIKQIESDLKKPLDSNADENALQEEDREVLTRLYELEKENLARVNLEISQTL